MRRFLISTASVAVLALATTGCAPDPLLGTYAYTGTIATMLTQPATSNTSDTTMGTAVVTATGAGYSVDFAATTSSQHCVLAATGTSPTITFTTGQTCSFSGTYNGTPYMYTATITGGNGVLSGNTMAFSVTYSLQGNAGAIALVGTGAQTLSGTRQAN